MAVLSSYPRISDAFKQGTHNGLNFSYGIGIVRKDNIVTKVDAGTVLLTDNAINYIEVDDTGIVSVNQIGYTSGKLPLYTVTNTNGEIEEIQDDRCFFNLTITGGGGYSVGWNLEFYDKVVLTNIDS